MYPAEADADENFRLMSFEQRGLYWTLLDHAWLNSGLPADPEEIREMCRLSKHDFDRMWKRVSKCFKLVGYRMVNPRQEIERSEAISKSEKATSAVRTRYERTTSEDTNVSIRASDSESYSSSKEINPKKEEQISSRARGDSWKLDEAFVNFSSHWNGSCTESDLAKAFRFEWNSIGFEQQLAASKHAVEYFKNVDPAFVKLPQNYLADREWERKPRPAPMSKLERTMRDL
jgi:uncharacterized protein YdaU (DUF1376 family)